ncbi:MAG: TetR/AcrR family transcriptional regulator [Oscillospiraceae bacterium]
MAEVGTREKILKTMYELVAEKGYDKASIGQLAEAIGIQKPSVYYYFKSKEDIFLQLVEELYRDDFDQPARLFQVAHSAADYRGALAALGENFIDSYFAHQTLRRVYAEIDLQTTRIPALKDLIDRSDKRFHAFLLDCMERGVALGAFPPDVDRTLNAQILYTVLIGIDQAVLYDLPIQPKPVWRAVVSGLFER